MPAPICVLLIALLATGCALQRSEIGGAPTGMDGSVPRPDGGAPPGPVDAGLEPDTSFDAGPPTCAEACTEGRVCEGSSCVCPAGQCCPGCVAPQVCSSGTCAAPPCGSPGEGCCAGEPRCDAGATCSGSMCVACGAAGQPCCGSECREGSCNGASVCEVPCGEIGQPCCADDQCDDGAACTGGSLGSARECRACGGRTEPCCAGASACDAGNLACDPAFDVCRMCGVTAGPCCAGESCPGSRCFLGYCQ